MNPVFINRKMLFLICCCTYVSAYLCRVNMSSAFYKLESALAVNIGSLGILGSMFFISYAVGQLINGFLGDRIQPYNYIAVAVFATVVLNIAISMSTSYYVVLICWTLNGYAQSMFWGPIMRLLSQRFAKSDNVNIATGMSSSIIIGFVLSWTIMGQLLADAGWILYFLIPAAVAVPVFITWVVLSLRAKGTVPACEIKTINFKQLFSYIIAEKLWVIAVICIALGLIKESVSLWAPVLLIKVLNIDVKYSFLLILIISLANFGGIILSKALVNKFTVNIGTALLFQFITVTLCSLMLCVISTSSILSVLLIAVISAMMYGANSILLGIIPLQFAHKNIVSTLVGIFDFSSYIGAAVSSFALGIMLADSNFKLVALIWLFTGIAAIVLSLIYRIIMKGYAVHGSKRPERSCAN